MLPEGLDVTFLVATFHLSQSAQSIPNTSKFVETVLSAVFIAKTLECTTLNKTKTSACIQCNWRFIQIFFFILHIELPIMFTYLIHKLPLEIQIPNLYFLPLDHFIFGPNKPCAIKTILKIRAHRKVFSAAGCVCSLAHKHKQWILRPGEGQPPGKTT